jgi:hypothetical protein
MTRETLWLVLWYGWMIILVTALAYLVFFVPHG